MNNTCQPLVSICIPTYNSVCYIRETLDSVRAQTYQHLEIIVSDNASNDGTAALLVEYAERYGIRVVLNDDNVGAGGNFNRLLSHANGEYVAIYHADDVYHSDIVGESVAVLQNHPAVGLVGTLAETIDTDGTRLFEYSLVDVDPTSVAGVFDFDAAFSAVLRTRKHEIFFVTPSIMVRRKAYDEVGSFDQKIWQSSVDYEMWLRIALRYQVAVLNRVLMCYRIHSGQGSELEVRKNVDLPDILAVLQAYQCHLQSESVKSLCCTTIDRIRIKTALKQNAVGQFTKSTATLEQVEKWRYRCCARGIRCVNSLRLNMHIRP
jgi:glycosyltransferase involved in cell wall biosynthesis